MNNSKILKRKEQSTKKNEGEAGRALQDLREFKFLTVLEKAGRMKSGF